MASYLSNLNWQRELSEFNNDEEKVLLALSNEKYKWRTKDRILSVTGLTPDSLDKVLSKLISKNKIRPSISKNKNVIYGLIERVGG